MYSYNKVSYRKENVMKIKRNIKYLCSTVFIDIVPLHYLVQDELSICAFMTYLT